MTRQNRVTPFSTLIATPARGTLTGNRGCLHDEQGQIRRQYLGSRWIICLLEFKGRKRPLMMPGHYTELFFLDEATALAAGHRPCAECQHERFDLYRETWAKANPELAGSPHPAAGILDAILHRERLVTGGVCSSLEDLPEGTFVSNDGQTAWLVIQDRLLRWKPGGYEHLSTHTPLPNPSLNPFVILTPPSVVRTLAAGYPVCIHSSAYQDI
jgi:hypothetical protein